MSVDFKWTDVIDGESDVVAKDINDIAHAVIGTIKEVDKKEDKSNKLSAYNENATEEQYYSAKAINEQLKGKTGDYEEKINKLTEIQEPADEEEYFNAKSVYDGIYKNFLFNKENVANKLMSETNNPLSDNYYSATVVNNIKNNIDNQLQMMATQASHIQFEELPQKEDKSNKLTTITSTEPTEEQYYSAKAVWDKVMPLGASLYLLESDAERERYKIQEKYDIDKHHESAEKYYYSTKYIDDNTVPSSLITPTMHSRIFRCKNLGNRVTDEQLAAIRDGSFDDLYLGDYWELSSPNGTFTFRIVDMDYWYNKGSTAFLKHHLVIMPDATIGSSKKMYDEGGSAGGYIGSDMYKTNLNDIRDLIKLIFPANSVLAHPEFLVNAITNGKPSGVAQYDCEIEIPNEVMMFGTKNMSPYNDGMLISKQETFCNTQLALFDISPDFINIRKYYWLRDVISDGQFCMVLTSGAVTNQQSQGTSGIRPYFCIG